MPLSARVRKDHLIKTQHERTVSAHSKGWGIPPRSLGALEKMEGNLGPIASEDGGETKAAKENEVIIQKPCLKPQEQNKANTGSTAESRRAIKWACEVQHCLFQARPSPSARPMGDSTLQPKCFFIYYLSTLIWSISFRSGELV